MTIEEAMNTFLSEQVTERTYPVVFPDDVVFPAIRYQRISGRPLIDHDGDSEDEQALIQVSCYGHTYSEAKLLAEQVKDALSGYSGGFGGLSRATLQIINETDLYESSIKAHHTALDVRIIASIT